MPLKHHTETFLLGIVGFGICLVGIVASLLPSLPHGLMYWSTALVLFSLYPIAILPTLRTHRADYTFRLLHWFPVAVLLLWLVVQVLIPYSSFFRVLFLGLFSFLSFPLVLLGLAFLAFFSMHVLRRYVFRLTLLVGLCIFFLSALGAVQLLDLHPHLQHLLFSPDAPHFQLFSIAVEEAQSFLGFAPHTEVMSETKLRISDLPEALVVPQSILLPASGPQSIFAFFLVFSLSLYSAMLHRSMLQQSMRSS